MMWKEKRIKEYVWNKVTKIYGDRPEQIIEIIMRRKLRYFGHKVRRYGMVKALIKGNVEGDRGRGRPRRQWKDDLKQWTGKGLAELKGIAEDRERWRRSVQQWVHPQPQ